MGLEAWWRSQRTVKLHCVLRRLFFRPRTCRGRSSVPAPLHVIPTSSVSFAIYLRCRGARQETKETRFMLSLRVLLRRRASTAPCSRTSARAIPRCRSWTSAATRAWLWPWTSCPSTWRTCRGCPDWCDPWACSSSSWRMRSWRRTMTTIEGWSGGPCGAERRGGEVLQRIPGFCVLGCYISIIVAMKRFGCSISIVAVRRVARLQAVKARDHRRPCVRCGIGWSMTYDGHAFIVCTHVERNVFFMRSLCYKH